MDKNIKKLISEAFNELYEEMVNEAPAVAPGTLETKGMTSDEIEPAIERAIKRGYDKKLAYDFDSGTQQSANFNIAMDNLLQRYRTAEDPTERENAKKAIQTAFSPSNRKFKNLFFKQFGNRPDFDDLVSDAYELTLLRNFDKTMESYKEYSGNLGAIVNTSMKNRIKNNIRGGWGAENSAQGDVYAGGASGPGMISVDQTIGDDGKMTVGDKISNSPHSSEFKGKGKINMATAKELKAEVMEWMANQYKEGESGISEIRYIAFKEIMEGVPPAVISKKYPHLFTGGRNTPTQAFEDLVKGPVGREISDMVSSIYGFDYNLADSNPNNMAQTFSQSPGWGEPSVRVEKKSKEMLAIQDELFRVLGDEGFSKKQLDSDKKILAAIQKVRENGKEETAEAATDIMNDLKDAGEKDSTYGSQETPLSKEDPKERFGEFMTKKGVNPEELVNWEVRGAEVLNKVAKAHGFNSNDKKTMLNLAKDVRDYSFGGMLEGIDERDVDILMERVIKRLSK